MGLSRLRFRIRTLCVSIGFVALALGSAREWEFSEECLAQAAICEMMERAYRNGAFVCGRYADCLHVKPDAEKAVHFGRMKQRYERAVHFPWNWLAARGTGCDAQLELVDAQLRVLARNAEAETKRDDEGPMVPSYFEYGEHVAKGKRKRDRSECRGIRRKP
jgi:hypothetical protein